MKFQSSLLLTTSCIFLLTLATIAQTNDRRIVKIQKRIENVMKLANCPGMAVAVVEKDQLIYSKGFGYKDYENKKLVTPNTLFAIGSCTKSFTSALIGQLEDEEKLSIDNSPREYLPTLNFYNREMNSYITIRDMLCHQTGLPRHDLSWYLFPSDSRDELLQRIEYHEPTLTVREGYQYNNFMYMAAGAVVESLTEQSWEENVRSRLLAPLEMSQTNLSIKELKKSEDFAFGYSTDEDKTIEKEPYYHILGMAPAGSINSSANEMANWLISWINGGEFKGKQVIPNAFVDEAISSQVVSSSGFPGEKHPDLHLDNYGFAWDISSYRGHYRVTHGGNIDGFTANTAFYPSDSIGIVVLVNQNFSRVPSYVRNIIADQLFGLPNGKWEEPLAKVSEKTEEEAEEKVSTVSKKVEGTTPSHSLEDYAGSYTHKGYGSMKIEVKEDSLFAFFPEKKAWLRHYHYDVFDPLEVEEEGIDTSANVGLRFNFHSNYMGEIGGLYMNVESGLDALFFKKELQIIEVSAEDLQPYVGEYDLGGALAKVFIEEGSLRLIVPGQPEYTLVASKKNHFSILDLEGYFIDFEEEDGNIIALTFMQPNGNFRVPKKK